MAHWYRVISEKKMFRKGHFITHEVRNIMNEAYRKTPKLKEGEGYSLDVIESNYAKVIWISHKMLITNLLLKETKKSWEEEK